MSTEHVPDRIGPYRVIRLLGAGGMGVVYEALNETIERRVAVKVLLPECARQPELTQRFFNEARAVNRINHPCIVQVFDFGQSTEGASFIVMELLEGETLAKRVKRLGGRASLSFSLQIGWQLATALTAAHAKEIVHRDLKPDNVMLVADPVAPGGERAKLLDFGIAKLAADARGGNTASQIIMGTPGYMSPEQCRGAGAVDAKSDVYSLGVMLFQLLSGRLPFVAEGAGELIAMHMFQEPPSLAQLLPSLPADASALVHRLLAKDRQQRPSMREVVALLEPMLAANSLGAHAAPTTLPPLDGASPGSGPPSTLGHSSGQRQSRAVQLPRAAILASSLFALTGIGLFSLRQASRRTSPASIAATQGVRRELPTTLLTQIPGAKLPEKVIGAGVPLATPPKAEPAPESGETTAERKPARLAAADATERESGRSRRRGSARRADAERAAGRGGIEPGRDLADSGPTALSMTLLQAQHLGAQGDWDGMLRLTQNPELLQVAPLRTWSLIGQAACHLRRSTLASDAYHRVEEAGRDAIQRECAAIGILIRGPEGGADTATADALHLASEHLFHSRFREAIAMARPLVRAKPEEAWRIIGQAACSLRDTVAAAQARRALSTTSQQTLDQACESSGLERTGDVYNIRVR